MNPTMKRKTEDRPFDGWKHLKIAEGFCNSLCFSVFLLMFNNLACL
jgi:hypothetical protein